MRRALIFACLLLFAACSMTVEKSAYQLALERYNNLPVSGPERDGHFARFEADLGATLQQVPNDPELRLLRAQVRYERYRQGAESKTDARTALDATFRRTYPDQALGQMRLLGRGVLEDARVAARIANSRGDLVPIIAARAERLIAEQMTLVALWGPSRPVAEPGSAGPDRQALVILAYLDVAAAHLRQARDLAVAHAKQDTNTDGKPDVIKLRQVKVFEQLLVSARRDLETVLWMQANQLSQLTPFPKLMERNHIATLELARDLRQGGKEDAVWDTFKDILPNVALENPEPLWLNGLVTEMSAMTDAIIISDGDTQAEREDLKRKRTVQARAALRVGAALEFEREPGQMPSIADPNGLLSSLAQTMVDF